MIDLQLTENDEKSFTSTMNQEMHKPIKHFEGELIKIRTGRAHTSIIEDIPVSAYGQPPMPLKNLAALGAPDVRLLTIQPWDINTINDIETAIQNSDLGISPTNDGAVIRLVLPEMSTNRRDELAKILGKKLEECKITIRNVRKDFNNLIRDAKKDSTISENFYNRLCDCLKKVTDSFIETADQMAKKKETELKTI